MIKILAIGSPFGEDQLGWELARMLQARDWPIPKNLSIEILDRPGLRLLEHMQGMEKVFLLDAVCSEAPAGTLYRLVDEEIESLDAPLSSHGVGIAQTVALGRVLGQLPPSLVFYGIAIDNSRQEAAFSAPVREAMDPLLEKLLAEIGRSQARSCVTKKKRTKNLR